MLEKLRYITNEQGQRVGILLNLEEYRQLTGQPVNDPDFLTGLSQNELEALAESMIAPAAQTRLDDLLARNIEARLLDEEKTELDQLLERIDQLNILKTRARYTLKQRQPLAIAA